jgi:hypothetical protein
MIYTQKIQKAVEFAIQTHEIDEKQKRKGKDIPYITHPLTVGLILSIAGASEDVVIAGILHDTIEDSVVTKEMIALQFGENVMQLVLSVTEQDKSKSWEVRKAEALEHIKTFSHDSLLLKSGDVIANTREILADYKKDGDIMFSKFNAPKEKILESSIKTIKAIVEMWPESPLAEDLLYSARELQMVGAGSFMSNNPAKIIQYRDYDENMPIECSVCNWKGTPKSSGWINTDSDSCLDVSCPICEKMILVANYS